MNATKTTKRGRGRPPEAEPGSISVSVRLLRKKGWYGRYLATVNGERKHVFVFLETRNEILARRKLDLLIEAEEKGLEPVLVESFEQAATRVQEIRSKTIANTRTEGSYLRAHVNPVIGRIPVAEVSKADVMSLLEAVRDKGLSAQTILHVRNTIAAVFKHLKREGVVEVLPVPAAEDLPEPLPEAVDERPKAVLSGDELLVYLAYTDPREPEMYRGAVRERQMMALLSRCVGGMRTSEIQGLTWARARADSGAFDALEVIRYKTRRKAAKQGSKAVARQLYPLGDTVLPAFLRYWHARHAKNAGAAPTLESVLFPVRRDRGRGESRLGARRNSSTWARALRRDIKRAFGLEVLEKGEWKDRTKDNEKPIEYPRRLRELLEGTDDRRPLWFHNARNAAAVVAERHERLKAAARFTGHASGSMLQHYRAMAGEIDVVPVLPELIPDASALLAVLHGWCEVDGIDPALVLFPENVPSDAGTENAQGKRTDAESHGSGAKVTVLFPEKAQSFQAAHAVSAPYHDGAVPAQRRATLWSHVRVDAVGRAAVVTLDLGSYDRSTGALRVSGKGNKERIGYVKNGTRDALHVWLDMRGELPGPLLCPVRKAGQLQMRRMTPQAVLCRLSYLAELAGVDRFSPHDLCGTFCSDLRDRARTRSIPIPETPLSVDWLAWA
jgi:site-specific recombinase XerD